MNATHTFWSDPALPFVNMRRTLGSVEAYTAHSHPEFCVGAVTEGVTLTTVRGTTHALFPGSLVLIAPEEVHSCNPRAGVPRSYLMAYLDVPWCRSIQEALFGPRERFTPPAPVLLENEPLFSAFVELAQLLASDAPTREKGARMTRFCGDLFAAAGDPAAVPDHTTADGIIPEVKSYLARHPERNITLDELAAAFRCTPCHLLRSFKKIVGLPPHAFLLNARIERAKQLLRDGVPVARVAQETGFADQSHFHRVFRRTLAATPRQYRHGFGK
ncbi:AraC family transcriptional regulator [Geobacter sp. FeAm09]|uniref:AraC family transcriptional regulator n=1 Tax=Geobacter sp. FeAm09 TaxID=2597769 RepID=UPI0011EF4306|nr:AraC family transcriptional regulator [Geobacter sp. FeAm09]QEM67494.1 AraC family transcriptional regulator [Geobacter sp. FeAm09]